MERKIMEKTSMDIYTYLANLEESRRKDLLKLVDLGKDITKKEPAMWGSIIGFDSLHYQYKTGHSGNMPVFAFASRANAITLYLGYDVAAYSELKELGKYKIGKGCLYIKKLEDIDLHVLEKLVKHAVDDTYKLDFIKRNED
ncbi:MAG: DUF1801 domain-containing protein [Candidatus Izemoplasmatales bacterium]|nr:DUF1801 domain-containing protein [Candidatus Izemoplasmatales bacterium]